MKLASLLFLSMISLKLFGQNESMPQFIGGEDALLNFIIKNTKYPPAARENCISGRVCINFVITKEGKVDSISVLRSVHKSVDDESIRIVNLTNGHWIPGKINDSTEDVHYNLPFNFKLDDPACKDKSYYYNKGVECLAANNFSKAIKNFEQAVEMDASYIEALYKCAVIEIKLNKISDACNFLKQIKKNGTTEGDELMKQYCKE